MVWIVDHRYAKYVSPSCNASLVLQSQICREAEAASLGLDTSKQTEGALSVHAPLAVAAWKGKGSLNVLVSKGKSQNDLFNLYTLVTLTIVLTVF